MYNQARITSSPEETFEFGSLLGNEIKPNTCVLISGDLGAGKTQLIKGLCAYYGIKPDQVQSPTYSLHHSYTACTVLHHFDLYRMQSTQEFFDRGFMDILETEDPIFIEWPSRIDPRVFKNKAVLEIDIQIVERTQRIIQIKHVAH